MEACFRTDILGQRRDNQLEDKKQSSIETTRHTKSVGDGVAAKSRPIEVHAWISTASFVHCCHWQAVGSEVAVGIGLGPAVGAVGKCPRLS